MDIKTVLSQPAGTVHSTGRIKEYPDGSFEIMAASRPIFKAPGWEESGWKVSNKLDANRQELSNKMDTSEKSEELSQKSDNSDAERAARRAAAKLRDYALCNDFRWFVTLTIDAARLDRYDVAMITKKINVWLDHQVRRDGLRYVLVPERHKDGAIHFHGLVAGGSGFVPSGTWSVPGAKKPKKPRSEAQRDEWVASGSENGFHEVFNWEGWKYGFSTAIELYGDYSAAVSYVCKYIRKQIGGGKIGGRWYYSGGELKTPEVRLLPVSFNELVDASRDTYTFGVQDAALRLAVLRGKSNGV